MSYDLHISLTPMDLTKFFDPSWRTSSGRPSISINRLIDLCIPNLLLSYEILYRHTNFRISQSLVVRSRCNVHKVLTILYRILQSYRSKLSLSRVCEKCISYYWIRGVEESVEKRSKGKRSKVISIQIIKCTIYRHTTCTGTVDKKPDSEL